MGALGALTHSGTLLVGASMLPGAYVAPWRGFDAPTIEYGLIAYLYLFSISFMFFICIVIGVKLYYNNYELTQG